MEDRKRTLVRDLNDLIREPVHGSVSEAKLWANVFKAAALYVFLTNSADIIQSWDIMMVFAVMMIAPDLFKKWVMVRGQK